jgi:hypothetical protein
MKQINQNPNSESQIQGFKILYVLLYIRRPSSCLFKYVLNFVVNRLQMEGEVGGLAVGCMQTMLDDSRVGNDPFVMLTHLPKVYMNMKNYYDKALPLSLNGISVDDIIRVENTAMLMLQHGILPPTECCYAWRVFFRIII